SAETRNKNITIPTRTRHELEYSYETKTNVLTSPIRVPRGGEELTSQRRTRQEVESSCGTKTNVLTSPIRLPFGGEELTSQRRTRHEMEHSCATKTHVLKCICTSKKNLEPYIPTTNSRRMTPKLGDNCQQRKEPLFSRKIQSGARNRLSPASVEWGGLRRDTAHRVKEVDFFLRTTTVSVGKAKTVSTLDPPIAFI
ncbi:hypothetical protein AVEN_205091-1, partial [Araneus ventricosus]